MQALWLYIKNNKLQDGHEKEYINCNRYFRQVGFLISFKSHFTLMIVSMQNYFLCLCQASVLLFLDQLYSYCVIQNESYLSAA